MKRYFLVWIEGARCAHRTIVGRHPLKFLSSASFLIQMCHLRSSGFLSFVLLYHIFWIALHSIHQDRGELCARWKMVANLGIGKESWPSVFHFSFLFLLFFVWFCMVWLVFGVVFLGIIGRIRYTSVLEGPPCPHHLLYMFPHHWLST